MLQSVQGKDLNENAHKWNGPHSEILPIVYFIEADVLRAGLIYYYKEI